MSNLNEDIAELKAGAEDPILIIYRLEESLGNERVLDCYLELLSGPGTDEDLLIELCNSLRVGKIPEDEGREKLAEALVNLVRFYHDEVVQQHAAMALTNFAKTQRIAEFLAEVVRDRSAEENLRHNALGSLEMNVKEVTCRHILEQLRTDPSLEEIFVRSVNERLERP